ncbi:hypothetical protein SAMN05518800_6786 [Variovorax sp. YR752]|nr:hypothetical protein SAMN05518800_6786 [Variovorax sp. YR752]
MPTSSGAASCCMSCWAASIASATTGSWPPAIEPPASHAFANCCCSKPMSLRKHRALTASSNQRDRVSSAAHCGGPMRILQTFARGQSIRAPPYSNSLGHHEYTSASAFSPSLSPSSSWVDAESCLRPRRRPGRRPHCCATRRPGVGPLRLIDAIGRTLASRHRHVFDSRRPNPHSFVAFSALSDAFRGFLQGGLSNTSPRAVGAVGAVVVHGLVSDNSRPRRPVGTLRISRSNHKVGLTQGVPERAERTASTKGSIKGLWRSLLQQTATSNWSSTSASGRNSRPGGLP